MFKLFVFVSLFVLCSLSGTEINLLANPEFKGHDDCLEGWNHNPMVFNGAIKRLPGEGPGKRTAIRIDFSRYGQLKQPQLKLAAGEKYRLGGWVRTKNFKSSFRVCSFLVCNQGWYSAVYSPRFPVDTKGKWVKIERVVTMPESSNGLYTFQIYGDQATGVFELCNPYLIPLSEKGRKSFVPAPEWRNKLKRVSPYYPLLTKVSALTGEIGFAVTSPAGADFTEYVCRVSYAQGTAKKYGNPKEFPFNRHGMAKTFLGKIPEGRGFVKAELVHKKSRKALYSSEYPMTAVGKLAVKGKWLNNFVFEIINAPLRQGKVKFTAPDGNWYRIAFSTPVPGASLSLGGKELFSCRKGALPEAMRYLERGEHTLDIKVRNRIPAGVKLLVARIPETPYHPLFPNKKSGVSSMTEGGYFKYDIDFCRKYLWNSFNTCFSQGAFPLNSKADHALKAEMKSRGMRILGCNGFPKAWWSNARKMEENIRNTLHVKNGDGRTLDEAFPNSPIEIQLGLIDLGWNMQNYDKLIYLWEGVYTDKYFDYPAIHLPLIASMSNISRGRGKVLLETYARVTPTEELMVRQLKRYPRQLEEVHYIPEAAERFIFFLGGYCKIGSYNTDSFPESDVKYFWDHYFHLLATHPACRNAGGVGAYSMGNCDEEMVRYFAALVRHYCLEGKTTLFSAKYGWKLNPGHLKDGDFREGFKHWEVKAASKGSLKAHAIPGMGRKYQYRQSRDIAKLGDSCALFVKSAAGANILSQKITGLKKGKLYSLTCVIADPDDMAAPRLKHIDKVFKTELADAEILPEFSYDLCVPGKWDKKALQRKARDIHVRKIVFRAGKGESRITFSDAGAPEKQKVILNFVTVRPYFEKEK